MPKMKTNRAAAKRFKMTASGKVKRSRGYLRHILTNKTRKQKRRLGKGTLVAAVDERAVKRLLPYGRP
jgi:large subunit ribosomal protein L35